MTALDLNSSHTKARNSEAMSKEVNQNSWPREYGDYLFRYAINRLKNAEVAEEVVQETFLSAIKGAKSFKGNSAVKTWLVGILKHKIIDHIRRESRNKSLSLDDLGEDELSKRFDEQGSWKAGLMPQSWTRNPAAVLEQKNFMSTLHGCLSKLPHRLKEGFSLRELDDLTTNEICQIMSITPSNLWVILYRARLQLRECLEINWLGQEETKTDSSK